MAGLEEGQAGGGGIGKAVGQQVEDLHHAVAARGAEAGGQVGDGAVREPGGQGLEDRVAQGAHGGLVARGAGPDHEVAGAHRVGQAQHVLRVVLPVRVQEQHHLALRLADAGLGRGAVAFVVGMAHHPRARALRALGGEVGGAVVDHQHLAPTALPHHARHHVRDRVLLVVGGDDHGDLARVSHGPRPPARACARGRGDPRAASGCWR